MIKAFSDQELLRSSVQNNFKHKYQHLNDEVLRQAVLAELYLSNGVELTDDERAIHKQYMMEIEQTLGRYTFDKDNPVELPSRKEIIEMGPTEWKKQLFFRKLCKNASGSTYKSDSYFLMTTRGVIRNKIYRMIFTEKGRSVVYEYLWANIVRKGWKDTPGYPLKKLYYDKGFLVHASSYRKVAEECFLNKNTVGVILNEFHQLGIIKLLFIKGEGKKFYQFVAILGTWSMGKDPITKYDKPVETFYRDEVFYLDDSGRETIH